MGLLLTEIWKAEAGPIGGGRQGRTGDGSPVINACLQCFVAEWRPIGNEGVRLDEKIRIELFKTCS